MIRRSLALALLAFTLSATVAEASWYDDYEAGLAAIRKGNWSVAAQKMSAAIKGNPKEGDRTRTYGTIMINYHPYYYRGVAYLNTGRYDEAVADFERTSGPGPENLGSIETLMGRAKKALADASEPTPEPARPDPPAARPAPVVTQPAPSQPAAPALPQIDPGLRQRASAALSGAKQRIQAAQGRRATGAQLNQAISIFTDATTRNAGARSNDDLSAVITMAENAGDLADLATAPVAAPSAPTLATTTPSPALPVVPKPTAATTAVINESADEVRVALEHYFAGEFDEATRRFQALAQKMPRNGWIHAFLGASQYSQYAFEAEESYRVAALESFRRAKQYRSWKDGLPPRYFSKRIRQVFSDTNG